MEPPSRAAGTNWRMLLKISAWTLDETVADAKSATFTEPALYRLEMTTRILTRVLLSLEAGVFLLVGGIWLASAFIPSGFVEGTSSPGSYWLPGFTLAYGMGLVYLVIRWGSPSRSIRFITGVAQLPIFPGVVAIYNNGAIQASSLAAAPPFQASSLAAALPFIVPAALLVLALRPDDGTSYGAEGRSVAHPEQGTKPMAVGAALLSGGGAIALGCLLIAVLFGVLFIGVVLELSTKCRAGC